MAFNLNPFFLSERLARHYDTDAFLDHYARRNRMRQLAYLVSEVGRRRGANKQP